MELIRQLDVVDQLRRVDAPTLVSVGELDPVTPVAAAEEIVGALPEGIAQLEVIADKARQEARRKRSVADRHR